ncbi:MAG: pilus assembly protein [bacterium]
MVNVLFRSALIGLLLAVPRMVFSANDIASLPLSYQVASQVKPNIFFLLDDSGSMQSSYLGDEVVTNGYEKKIGYRNHLCNKIYYNPSITYEAPVRADGTLYPQQNFTDALYDGYNLNSITVDLSSSFTAWRTATSVLPTPSNTSTINYHSDCSTITGADCATGEKDYPNKPEPAFYFIYQGSQANRLGDGSSEDHCLNSYPSPNWRKVVVSSRSGLASVDERINFANWYSYYRTRILTMKSAVGKAFRDIGNQFRVGFSTIGYSGVNSEDSRFLKISDFDLDHKQQFYKKLYSVDPLSSTPLRAALSKAGRLYAGKLLTDAEDPVRFSCQQNFTILSTDGYWNTSWESGSYGPKMVDGQTDVGNQDHDLPRPMFDGDSTASPIRAAKLTIRPSTTINAPYMVIVSIRVDGKNLLGGVTGVYIGTDLDLSAANLAWSIALNITKEGFRAIALGNDVYIIAPPTASQNLGAPVVDYYGKIETSVESFKDIPRTNGTSNTLADVAAYYFRTDLRQPLFSNCPAERDVCTNNVPIAPGSRNGNFQHMVTHTVGLGASGSLHYREDYSEANTGDFEDIVRGRKDWPDPLFNDSTARVDDLWHAAVNGGGHYFNASNPESLAKALSGTLSTIRASVGAATAASTSNQQPVEGDNLVFSSHYRSIYWDGDVEARRINLNDGTVSAQVEWSASSQLDSRVSSFSDKRKIWIQSTTNASQLTKFVWSDLSTADKNLFQNKCTDSTKFSQCQNLEWSQQREFTGERLVNYLRGQYGFEDRANNSLRLFRRRDHVLGAVISAQPIYVARPAFRYSDENYGVFRDTLQAKRKGMLYVVANDGMLHALDATTGEESWAFIPAGVLPELYKLADLKFGQQSTYLFDGPPVVADICPGTSPVSCTDTAWRTILVVGLGSAGREFFALDVTDPDNPQSLWRFTASNDSDLGYAMGKPVITKRRDGRWIVALTSGYNNIEPGSGEGVLFILDAYTGAVLQKIRTGAGSIDSPAGLAQINGWVESSIDNTTSRFYGGDLLGNVWRFDIDDLYPPAGNEALLIASLIKDRKAQPITTRPELSEVRVGTQHIPVVTIGTGSYLGLSDLTDKSVQSIYTIKDELTGTGFGDIRASGKIVQQTLVQGTAANELTTSTTQAVDWQNTAGWYVDLNATANSGERITLDPEQQLGILRVVSNVPDKRACRPSAQSWIYEFDYQTGSYLPMATEKVVGRKISDSNLIAGKRTLKLGEKILSLLTDESGKITSINSIVPTSVTNSVKRVSWREIDEQ